MSKCTNECNIRIDSRTGESECFQHGTVTFTRQAYDALDDSEFLQMHKFKYSDKFCYNAVKNSPLTMDELAAELNIHEETLRRAARRYAKANALVV